MDTLDRDVRHLRNCARALPVALRGLEQRPDGLAEGIERADELLAELDLLLTRCLGAPTLDRNRARLAVQSIGLKADVYRSIGRFVAGMGMSRRSRAGFRHAATSDLHDSRERLRHAWHTRRDRSVGA